MIENEATTLYLNTERALVIILNLGGLVPFYSILQKKRSARVVKTYENVLFSYFIIQLLTLKNPGGRGG